MSWDKIKKLISALASNFVQENIELPAKPIEPRPRQMQTKSQLLSDQSKYLTMPDSYPNAHLKFLIEQSRVAALRRRRRLLKP
jgi:hypothetical protein